MKKAVLCLMILILSCQITACGHDRTEKENASDPLKIYYINNEETKLVYESYQPESEGTEELIDELLEAMGRESKNVFHKRVLSETIRVTNYVLSDKGLTLNFNEGYSTLSGITEILYRAAIVKTLCQIKGVPSVEFSVNNQPLMATSDKAVGFMSDEDFIDNTGSETNFYQNANMNLFFANKKGDALKEVRVNVVYDGTIPMEQLIIERLISGPSSISNVDTDKIFPTLPANTKLLKTSVKDGICYVDFNEAFLEKIPDITDEVAIYSIVNSLVEMSTINKVQFTINGEQRATYRESTEFNGQFQRNLDLVK